MLIYFASHLSSNMLSFRNHQRRHIISQMQWKGPSERGCTENICEITSVAAKTTQRIKIVPCYIYSDAGWRNVLLLMVIIQQCGLWACVIHFNVSRVHYKLLLSKKYGLWFCYVETWFISSFPISQKKVWIWLVDGTFF